MPPFVYDPSKAKDKFSVPEGRYLCVFRGTEEVRVEQSGKYAQQGDIRLRWTFEIVSPSEFRDKKIDPLTGMDPSSPKSAVFKMLRGLLGRSPKPMEGIDPADFVGKFFSIKWGVNEESDKGNSHIKDMDPAEPPAGWSNGATPAPAVLPAGAVPRSAQSVHPAAPPPAPPAPPRPPVSVIVPPAPPAPPPAAARQFWVMLPGDQGPAQMAEADIRAWLREQAMIQGPGPKDLQVNLVGGDGQWRTANLFGFEDAIPW